MLALILVRAAMPMPIGSSPLARWILLAGNHHPAQRHFVSDKLGIELLGAGDRLDLRALLWPARAYSIWVIVGLR